MRDETRDGRTTGSQALGASDPRRIGAYDILAHLGVGGMGTVYLGRSPDSTLVAIKLVHSHLAMDREFRGRFSREVQAGRRVPPFCSARVLDSGEYDRRPYLVTEYIDGIPLSQYVAEDGPLDLPSLHSLALGTAAGLAAIHTAGLVHRDVKPSNIMLTMGGVRIIDFGIARALDDSTSFTRSGVVMGSLGWAAPEQLCGETPSPAMDIFGWGCVMGFAATGEHPFGGTDLNTYAWRVLHQRPDLSGVPEPLRSLIRSALDRSPQLRPTAKDLLQELIDPKRVPKHSLGLSRRTTAAVMVGLPVALAVAIAAAGGPGLIGGDDRGHPGAPYPASSSNPSNPPMSGTPGGGGGGSRPTGVDYVPGRGRGSVADQPKPSGSDGLRTSAAPGSPDSPTYSPTPPTDTTKRPKPSKTKKKAAMSYGPTWPVLVPPPGWPPVIDGSG